MKQYQEYDSLADMGIKAFSNNTGSNYYTL